MAFFRKKPVVQATLADITATAVNATTTPNPIHKKLHT